MAAPGKEGFMPSNDGELIGLILYMKGKTKWVMDLGQTKPQTNTTEDLKGLVIPALVDRCILKGEQRG